MLNSRKVLVQTIEYLTTDIKKSVKLIRDKPKSFSGDGTFIGVKPPYWCAGGIPIEG